MSTQFRHQQKLIVPERIIPGQTPVYLFPKHISRYGFATSYVSGKTVLEIGCGHGYGTFYLAQHADNVLGIDVASEVITVVSLIFLEQLANSVPTYR
jgi:2-polyprenyl-3-methyl-5-hydroxy-6-metoxy-1,4-benzoquinol methylase